MAKRLIKFNVNDLNSLEEGEYINDRVITRFTETLGPKHNKYVRVNDAIILNTGQVYSLDLGQENITKDISAYGSSRILFILNVSTSGGELANHWICIEVGRSDSDPRLINVYDSLLANLDNCIKTPTNCPYYTKLAKQLNLWVANKYKITFKKCTQQNNGYDCGLFAMDALKARAFKHDIVRTVTREGLKKLANLQPCFVCGLFKAIVWPVSSNTPTDDDSDIVEITESSEGGPALSNQGSLNATPQTPKQTG